MKRHAIDKFGSTILTSVNLRTDADNHYSLGNKRLRFVAEPQEPHETVTKGYLERLFASNAEHEKLSKRVGELSERPRKGEAGEETGLIKLDGTDLDAGGRKITNVKPGVNFNDVSTVAQSCTYDESVGNFKCGSRYFNLVENSANCPVLCAKYSESGEVTLSEYGKETIVKPKALLYYEPNSFKLTDNAGTEIVWDQDRLRFSEIYYTPIASKRP